MIAQSLIPKHDRPITHLTQNAIAQLTTSSKTRSPFRPKNSDSPPIILRYTKKILGKK
jgi:hypothetical protein